ncbi:MATE family efflux transporter [Streptococcus halichoeri]|uniref:MATE family efflux transporter n=1 Tax=Streptococcus halichoeri TaxID=254785 RepID=UPI00135AF98E|nr:MATE family efflux transporter [Streptococcus halichoeri]
MPNNRRKLLTVALPAMVENILQMLMGLVDSYLIAKISLVAVSGVAMANNLLAIYQAIFIAIGAAATSLVAKAKGESDYSKQQAYIANALLLSLLLSFILGLLSFFFGYPLLHLLGAEPLVAQTGASYLAIVGGLVVSLGLLTVLGGIVRALGFPRLPMEVSLITNILNAGLSLLALFVLGWGLTGVAFATVIARFLGVLLLVRRLPLGQLRFKSPGHKMAEVMAIALPAAGERLMMRLGDLMILTILVRLGTKVVAGNAIGESISQFNYMPGLAVATATLLFVSEEVGQGHPERVKKLVRDSYWLSLGMMLVISGLVFLFGDSLSSQFTSDSLAKGASLTVLGYSLLFAPCTAGTLVYTALWQGLGNARLPFYATTIGMWLIRILGGYFLTVSVGIGYAGIWIATGLDNAFRWFFLSRLYAKQLAKKKKDEVDELNSEA